MLVAVYARAHRPKSAAYTREAAYGRRLCQQGGSFPPVGMNRSTGQTNSTSTS